MRHVKNNQRKDEKESKMFKKHMEKGKISYAIRCLTEETEGVLSLSEKIDGEKSRLSFNANIKKIHQLMMTS